MREYTIADFAPYGIPTAEGVVDLRGRGRIIGYDMGGLSPEACSDAERDRASRQVAKAMKHLGTGDMLHAMYFRVPVLEYPQLQFQNAIAKEIDDERREQFKNANYWRTIKRLYLTHAYDGKLKGRAKAAFFSSTNKRQLTRDRQWDYFLPYAKNFEDSTATVLKLRRLSTEEMFRDFILAITGRHYPALVPQNHVRINEVVASDKLYGGERPWTGDLCLRPVAITTYPTDTVPHMMSTILNTKGQLTISIRFICQDPPDTDEQLVLERTFWVRDALGSLMDMFCKAVNIPRRPSLNQDAEKQIAEVDEAIAKAAAGLQFGWCTIVVTVIDSTQDNADHRARQLIKELAGVGLGASLETTNASEAFYGSWPGNGWHNIRRPMLSAENLAELMLPIQYYQGTPYIDSMFFQDDNHNGTKE
jgi:type IV secretion system protein TrbE